MERELVKREAKYRAIVEKTLDLSPFMDKNPIYIMLLPPTLRFWGMNLKRSMNCRHTST